MPEDHEDYVPAPTELVPQDGIIIEFPDEDKVEAGNSAKDLKTELDNAMVDANLIPNNSVLKVNPNTQDDGTIIGVILAAKATIALATGIALWMRRKNQSRIRIRYADGTAVDITNTASADNSKIIDALNKRPAPPKKKP